MPFATATVGLGSRGKSVRFYTDFEANVARVRVNALQSFFHVDSAKGPGLVFDSQQATPIMVHPKWAAVRLGVEFPLVSP
jgi:hypothetical protein